jgi:hypothetical protein
VVMLGGNSQSEEVTRCSTAYSVSFSGTPVALCCGGMERGGPDEAVNGNPTVVVDGGMRWHPFGHQLGK